MGVDGVDTDAVSLTRVYPFEFSSHVAPASLDVVSYGQVPVLIIPSRGTLRVGVFLARPKADGLYHFRRSSETF